MKKNHSLSTYTFETKNTVPVCWVMREELSFGLMRFFWVLVGVLLLYLKGSELCLVCSTLTTYKLNSLSLSWFYEWRYLFWK